MYVSPKALSFNRASWMRDAVYSGMYGSGDFFDEVRVVEEFDKVE